MPRVIFVYFREAFILKKCNICQTWGGDPAYKMSHFLALTRSSGSHSVLLSVPWSISSLSVVSQLSLSCLSVVSQLSEYQKVPKCEWAAEVSRPMSSWSKWANEQLGSPALARSPSCFDYFWQLLKTFDNFWQLLTTFDNFWQLLTTYDSLWQLMTAYDSLRQLKTA